MSTVLVRSFPTLVAGARELPIQPVADTLRDRRRYLNGQEKFQLGAQAITAASQVVTAVLATQAERQLTARHAAQMDTDRAEIARLDRASERSHCQEMTKLHHKDQQLAADAKGLESGLAMAELAMACGDYDKALAFYDRALQGRAP
jgi:hypothetical protein